MNWYVQQRRIWIEEMLRIYGYINRRHICDKFGCSPLTAAHDLTACATRNADWVKYDASRKAYVNTRRDA